MGEVTTAVRPARPAPQPRVVTPSPLPAPLLSRPGDAAERSAADYVALARAARGSAAGLRGIDGVLDARASSRGRTAPSLPSGVPTTVAARAPYGRPLEPALAERFAERAGADLAHVRLHDDAAAHALADAAGARAFTAGSHVFMGRGEFRPETAEGIALLDHELAHVLTQPHLVGGPLLLREPKTDAKAAPSATAAPTWSRMVVDAKTMDDAALVLGEFVASDGRPYVFVGLSPTFVKVYDTHGRPLGSRVPFKEDTHLSFDPGVYAVTHGTMLTAVEILGRNVHRQRFEPVDLKNPGSVVGRRTRTDAEQKHAFDDAAADPAKRTAGIATPPQPVRLETLNIDTLLTDVGAVRAMMARVPGAVVLFFVPRYPPSGSGHGGGEAQALYSSPIQGRGDGLPANSPPWPVSIEGPRRVPRDASPTFSAKIDWTANGNWSNRAAQVISNVGESIHYRWDYFDITSYAKAQLAKAAAKTKAVDPKAPPEKTFDQRVADFTKSAAGSGKDVTGSAAARREFSREFENWWKDTKRAAHDARNPRGETVAERLSNAEANQLSIELTPVTLVTTAVGATVRFIADSFAGPRDQQEVNLPKDGVFLIRVISTPAVREDLAGKPVIRPPSVAGHIVDVAEMDKAIGEALDEPGAQLAELRAQIALAEQSGKPGTAAYLRDVLAREELKHGPVLTLLEQKRTAKIAEIAEFEKNYRRLSSYSLHHELEGIEEQIQLYADYDARRSEGARGLGALARVNAVLYLESTGEQYPLLLSAGPMSKAIHGPYRWMVADVSTVAGANFYTGEGATPSKAFGEALAAFGRAASYGRGRIGAQTAGLGLESNKLPPIVVDSAPADWALAQNRLDDLVEALAAVGIVVASAGTASAIIGAGLAAARMVQRWRAGHLSLDSATMGDLLSIAGGFSAAGHLVADLRVAPLGRGFALLQEGAATEAELARAAEVLAKAESLAAWMGKANEVIGHVGIMWGDIAFVDKMIDINEKEASGTLTHAGARRERANGIASVAWNHGLMTAGSVLKARQQAKATARTIREPAVSDKPPAERPLTDLERARAAGYDVSATPRIGERPATEAELREALPPDLRDLAVIDATLHGDHVTVDWTKDPRTGLIDEISIRISPHALPSTVALHAETVRIMQRYQGFSGRLRQALTWAADLFEIPTLTPADRRRFNAELEVRKLPPIIAEHLAKLAAMPETAAEELNVLDSDKPTARAEAEALLDSLVSQMEEHLATLEGGAETGTRAEDTGVVDAESEGVSARGVPKAKLPEYARLMQRRDAARKGSNEYYRLGYRMYELTGGKYGYEQWLANQKNAPRANRIVAAELRRLGWIGSEYTVTMDEGPDRRVDLYNKDGGRREAAEVKAYRSGSVSGSERNLSEVRRDAALRDRGWKVTWIFIDCLPTESLKVELQAAGIAIDLRRFTRGGSERIELIPALRRRR